MWLYSDAMGSARVDIDIGPNFLYIPFVSHRGTLDKRLTLLVARRIAICPPHFRYPLLSRIHLLKHHW